MTYTSTARALAAAEQHDRTAAAALSLSEWTEARRDLMTAQTVALNHAAHVSDCAHALRDALTRAEGESNPMHRLAILADVEDAARALLAAIGEGEA